ncbi:hypothetical protein ACFL18_01370 [Patescibacteria group bacterium]
MNPAPIKASTQDHLDIEDIRDNLIILKDGSCAIIIETTAVNFSLLSEGEQDATIYAYAGLLNSLTFPIQIIVKSQKKDISNYLGLLQTQKQKIKNPLLKNQMEKYINFIQKIVQENEVLDKKFYLSIPFSNLELGVKSTLKSSIKKTTKLPFDKSYIIQKAKTKLLPKKDHLVSQLTRLGLKAKLLTTPELIKLMFQYYNPDSTGVEFDQKPGYSQPLVQANISPETPARLGLSPKAMAGGPATISTTPKPSVPKPAPTPPPRPKTDQNVIKTS